MNAVQISAADFFTARLQFQTDVADVRTGMGTIVLVDSRGDAGWRQGHIPGAVHLPNAAIPDLAPAMIDRDAQVVTYCWGPGCNGATKAALAFATLGYQVKEMIGGIEYWIREGFPLQTPDGLIRQAPDPLTAPVHAVTCDC